LSNLNPLGTNRSYDLFGTYLSFLSNVINISEHVAYAYNIKEELPVFTYAPRCMASFEVGIPNHIFKYMVSFSEIAGKKANTDIFRNVTLANGRKINIINNSLPEGEIIRIKNRFSHIARVLSMSYDDLYLDGVDSLQDNVFGFVKGKSYIDHATKHINSMSIASVDISKFYPSCKLSTLVEHNTFYLSFISSFMMKTGMDFCPASFTNIEAFEKFNSLFKLIAFSLNSVLSGITHNGCLPTGASYSPALSNFIFAPMDKIIKDTFPDLLYSRYADDICVSSIESKVVIDGISSYKVTISNVNKIEKIVRSFGFFLKYDKTNIMGSRDKKVIAGITIDQSNASCNKLSVGTRLKMDMMLAFSGKDWSKEPEHEDGISLSDKGKICWVRSINLSQYQFITKDIIGAPINPPPLLLTTVANWTPSDLQYRGTGRSRQTTRMRINSHNPNTDGLVLDIVRGLDF